MITPPVPQLNLAPKRRKPLSLWNPLDYFQLLYWVFFFPQAVRWYVENFGEKQALNNCTTWEERRQWWQNSPKQRSFWLQGLLLTVLVPIAITSILSSLFGVSISTFGVAVGVAFGVAFGVAGGVAGGVAFGVAVGVAVGVGILRPEIWLVTIVLRRWRRYRASSYSRVTSVPLIGLGHQLARWLHRDWVQAVHNLNELLNYTQQFIPAVEAVNYSLARLPDDVLLLRVSQLAENPYDWDLLRYASASLSHKMKEEFIGELFFLPGGIKRRLKSSFDTTLRLNTPARAATAGFWHLHENQPHKAAAAFSCVQHLPHGQEMHQLATCCALALSADQLNDSKLVTGLSIPTSPLLRTDTWPAISRFRSVVNDAQIIYQSYSRSAKSLALNRALGKLTEVLKKVDRIPQAERALIKAIAESWQEKLLAIATDVGEVTHTQPVANPYVAGDPVEGKLFVGRGEVIQQLEELWVTGGQLQSVVLFGHRRMGKTSILKNMSGYLGNNVKVAYVNLLNLGAVSTTQGEGEVLIALSDAISQALSLSSPSDEDLLNLPSATFRRFIQSISQQFQAGQGLIIALDEFEKIEKLITAGSLSQDFLGFLRGLLQEYSNIAFAFAGLHTLEEMTADYFNPLFASILPIRIGFLGLGETRQLLANPDEEFTLDYTPDTLNEIYRLTAGQPYLTQLIGFQLVRHFNHQVFEEGSDRTPIFTPQDLNTVIHRSDFFAKGRYYFTGVWNQAAQDAPGQQTILQILARKTESRSLADLQRKSGLTEDDIHAALKTLKRHDVIQEVEGKWNIIVPLFHQWVSENK